MKKAIVEFIGTFFLVFTVGMTVTAGAAFAPFAIGSVLMVMVYAGGHVSGGHFNPAVSLSFLIRGRQNIVDFITYVIAQLLAAVVAVFLVRFFQDAATMNKVAKGAMSITGDNTVKALAAEFIFTFALVWVIHNVADCKATSGNSFYGLAIGFTLLVGAITVGGISGGAFNPAVALGVCMLGITKMAGLWVYMVGTLAGGAVAAIAFSAFANNES